MDAFFKGQENGLLGAALHGSLFLVTGLHTGSVRLRVEVLESEPELDDRWDELVEATFEPAGLVQLVDWDGNEVCTIPLESQAHRVRYHARGMDEPARPTPSSRAKSS